MQIEVLEPGVAVPKGRGYVGVGDPGDTIFFPHLDSCCGIAVLFKDNRLIGGHVGAQWPGQSEPDYEFCGNQIITLMEANRKRVDAGAAVTLIVVYPKNSGNWAPIATKAYQSWSPDAMIHIDTSNCASGADVVVTDKTITVVDCKTKYSKAYPIPTEEMTFDTQLFPHSS